MASYGGEDNRTEPDNYVTDATLTWDMVQPDGQVLAAADIKTRTATVLQGRFATLCTVQQALDRAAA